MKNYLINYLSTLGLEYKPGMRVRDKAWQGNSSSEHTAYISQEEMPEKLKLEDYPELEKRIVGNTLFITTTEVDECLSKKGWYFSDNHYTVINKINYALSLILSNSRWNDSLYASRRFKFGNKRELEESKRLLIKYYSDSTRMLRLILIKHFDLDYVVFPFDKYVTALSQIEEPTADAVFDTLVKVGLTEENNESLLKELEAKKEFFTDTYFDVESIDHQSVDSMEDNILENEEVLTNFILSKNSEVYPVYEGSEAEVYDNLVEHGMVKETEDEGCLRISADILFCDEVTDKNKISKIHVEDDVNVFTKIEDYAQNLVSDLTSDSAVITNTETGERITSFSRCSTGRRGGSFYLLLRKDLGCPVLTYKNTDRDYFTNSGINYGTSGIDFKSSYHTVTVTTFNGTTHVGRIDFTIPYGDLEKLRSAIEYTKSKMPPKMQTRPSFINPIEDVDLKGATKEELSNILHSYLDSYVASCFNVILYVNSKILESFDDYACPYLERVEKNGVVFYWVKFSKIMEYIRSTPAEGREESVTDIMNVLGGLQKEFGSDFVDRMLYTIPVTIKPKA
jgi:hypothetical protein